MSHLPQLHLHISSTSNGNSKLLNNKTDININKNTSLTSESPFSPSLPQTPSLSRRRQHTPITPSYSPPHPSIIPPFPIPSFPIPSSTPPSSPIQITSFPTINNDSPTEHPNPHHPSIPPTSPSTTLLSHPQRWGFPISPPPLPHPFPPRGSPQEQALLRFSRYGRGSFSPIQFHFPVHSLISL